MSETGAFRPSREETPRRLRRLSVFVRDTRVLLREFRWQLFVGAVVLFGGAALLSLFYDGPGARPAYPEAVYDMIQMLALQNTLPFPSGWGLRMLFFAIPVVSFAVLADGLVRFAVLFFNRKNRMEAWNVSLAATEKNHVVICGLGRIGYRIALELEHIGQRCVAVEMRKDEGEFVESVRSRGFAVLLGDARSRAQLEAAGVARARAVICATNNDLANVEIALTARQISPGIRVVVRMFDAGLAEKFGSAFDMETFSTTAISAPVFASAALDRSILHSFHLGTRTLSVARLLIRPGSAFVGKLVRDLEARFDASIVALVRGPDVDLHPAPEVTVSPGDELAVLASLDVLRSLEDAAA